MNKSYYSYYIINYVEFPWQYEFVLISLPAVSHFKGKCKLSESKEFNYRTCSTTKTRMYSTLMWLHSVIGCLFGFNCLLSIKSMVVIPKYYYITHFRPEQCQNTNVHKEYHKFSIFRLNSNLERSWRDTIWMWILNTQADNFKWR